ncbi:hypothetical protein CPB85DRAFT_790870 [Mucidula mucida]|nr:hypothetical protein CPB85DRAFT_790870 [Mucidula mucida]
MLGDRAPHQGGYTSPPPLFDTGDAAPMIYDGLRPSGLSLSILLFVQHHERRIRHLPCRVLRPGSHSCRMLVSFSRLMTMRSNMLVLGPPTRSRSFLEEARNWVQVPSRIPSPSIAFTGTSPPAGITSGNFSVTIDDTTSDAQFDVSLPVQYGQWYQSPELDDGEHTITVSDLEQVGVDYALVTTTSPQDRSDVVVDDSDSSITYSGTWSESAVLHSNTSQVLPSSSFGSGVQDGRSGNSLFSFPFNGAEVTIYLVLRRSVVGSLRATVDVDGQTLDRISIWTTASGDDRPNFPVFTSRSLSSGAHVLTVNLTEVNGDQMFSLDYLSFTNVTQSPDGPSAATIATKSGGATTGTRTSTSLQTSFSTDSAVSDGQGVETLNVGAIAGGVIGGLLAVAAMIFILWWFRRRRQREVNKSPTLVPYPSQIQTSPSSFGSDAPMLSSESPRGGRRKAQKEKESMARVRLEVERLKLEMSALGTRSGSSSQVEALQKKIDDLSAENSRLHRALAT